MQLSSNHLQSMKVPSIITLYFWIIKILATTVGETGADFLIFKVHFGIANTSLIMSAALIGVLYTQIRTGKYIPWLYWASVVMVSIVGTLITDNLTDNLQVPLGLSTLGFSVALIATFWIWHHQEGTLSIHSIFSLKRELFYWAAILFTFAMGTAAGDLIAESAGLGYALSSVIFACIIALIAIGYYGFRLNGIVAFWLAYVITRPLGASVGDYLSHSVSRGGLGFGTVGTSAIFILGIIVLVTYLSLSKRDTPSYKAPETQHPLSTILEDSK